MLPSPTCHARHVLFNQFSETVCLLSSHVYYLKPVLTTLGKRGAEEMVFKEKQGGLRGYFQHDSVHTLYLNGPSAVIAWQPWSLAKIHLPVA